MKGVGNFHLVSCYVEAVRKLRVDDQVAMVADVLHAVQGLQGSMAGYGRLLSAAAAYMVEAEWKVLNPSLRGLTIISDGDSQEDGVHNIARGLY